MLSQDKGIIQLLRQICARFSADPDLQQDLLQECLIHLWRMERAKPNQTRSWYLQSCRFQIQHWLASGRSLDNPRRSNSERRISIHDDAEHPALEDYNTNGELFEAVCFQDAVSTLAGRVGRRQRKVLNGLAEGQTLSEIASQTKLSYPTVLKYRRIIADLSTKLGIEREDAPRGRRRLAGRATYVGSGVKENGQQLVSIQFNANADIQISKPNGRAATTEGKRASAGF